MELKNIFNAVYCVEIILLCFHNDDDNDEAWSIIFNTFGRLFLVLCRGNSEI
jgi:hypothetical protein